MTADAENKASLEKSAGKHKLHICPGCLDQQLGLWNRFATPVLINAVCGASVFTRQRQRLLPLAGGTVVELGPGTGLNLDFYQAEKIEKLIGIDPGYGLLRKAHPKTLGRTFATELYCESAEDMPLPDNIADAVVSTYTFCSIPDIEAAINEVIRILKPGGKLYFSEHGLSNNARTARLQNRLNPYWNKIAGGCNLNRDISTLLKTAGFTLEKHENFSLKGIPDLLGYHHFGIARPAK